MALEKNSSDHSPVYVTKPFLPPLADVVKYLEGVWDCRILTNSGPLHEQLENELASYLGVPYISLFANGTLALLVALKALRLQGEVITTPFSFVATSEALTWNGLLPVFADIQEKNFGLNPSSIESCITPNTSAILAVHCYGMPSNVHEIQEIADNYNLKVIYDAAHAFGVRCCCGSVLLQGDLSVLSFHATKVFNTFEGGAIVCADAKTKKRIDRLKNFGFVDETTVAANGINAKMNEIQAAVGLAQLPLMESVITRRRQIAEMYIELLSDLPGLLLPDFSEIEQPNFSYFPIRLIDSAPVTREELLSFLKRYNIYPRRYFYPLIPEFRLYSAFSGPDRLPIARMLASQVLCLPIYPDLSNNELHRVCYTIRKCFNR